MAVARKVFPVAAAMLAGVMVRQCFVHLGGLATSKEASQSQRDVKLGWQSATGPMLRGGDSSRPESSGPGTAWSATLVLSLLLLLPWSQPVAAAPASLGTSSITLAAAEKVDWARWAAGAGAAGLKTAGEALPKAEEALEEQASALKKPVSDLVTFASKVTPENAQDKVSEGLPVLGTTAYRVAESTARLGLQAGSFGAKFVADNLPAAGAALDSGAKKVLPIIQSGLHTGASYIKKADAGDVSPALLQNVAAGLDTIADQAPAAESFIAYGAGMVLPVAQSALGAASRLAADAAKVPLPEPTQVASSLQSLGSALK